MQFPSSGARRVYSSSGQSSKPPLAGTFIHKDATGKIVAKKSVYVNKELIIGRDRTKCQWSIDDAQVSRKHLRIYSVVYDADDPSEVDILVYAEDLSLNGTYWNGSFVGKGNGGFLLSQDDCLKLSSNVFLSFRSHRNLENFPRFDLVQETEMKDFANSYLVTDRLLGSGAFGRVFMAIELKSRSQLACKVVDLRPLKPRSFIGRREEPSAAQNVDSRTQLRKVREWAEKQKRGNKLENKLKVYYREVEILTSLNHHPNIISLEKVFITDNTLYMFQDLITAGDLFSYIEFKNGRLLEVEAAVIIRQVLIALCFLHDNKIVHRDLKPDNILMTSLSAGCRVVLTDFGAARRIKHSTSRMSSIAGTDEYAAPEVFEDKNSSGWPSGYTMAVDLWSLGCITAVLLTGGSAFNDPKTNNYSEKLAKECNLDFLRKSPEWQEVRPRPSAFVERLLVLNGDQRMTAPEALEHEWFSNDIHKTNFQELYERTIRHWRSRQTKTSIIEFRNAEEIQSMDALQALMPEKRSRKSRNDPVPQEPHLKPFPRNLFVSLQPPRRHDNKLSHPEVQAAIEEHWSNLSSVGEQQRNASRMSQGKSRRSSPAPVMGPPPTKLSNTARRNRTESSASRKSPSLNRTTSFRLPINSDVSKGVVNTLAQTLPTANKTKMPPPLVSSHFQKVVPLRPASSSDSDEELPWNRRHSSVIAQGNSHDEELCVNQEIENLNDVVPESDNGETPENFKRTSLNYEAYMSTPAARHKLRRLSTNVDYASPLSECKKRSRGSVFDIHDDADGDVEVEASRSAKKKQKHLQLDADAKRNMSRNGRDSQDTEVTLPHHINACRHSGTCDNQDLYLPR